MQNISHSPFSRSLFGRLLPLLVAILFPVYLACSSPVLSDSFPVDRTPVPKLHHEEIPEDGSRVSVNPPSMVWRHDGRAASYVVEFSKEPTFPQAGTTSVGNIPYAFYNHAVPFDTGTWFWRYFAKAANGAISAPGPVRSFVVEPRAISMPLPPMKEVLRKMPDHPRIFVTPDRLAGFREVRNGAGKDAWDSIKIEADKLLKLRPQLPEKRIPIAEAKIRHSKISMSHTWKKGDPVRRQVFWLDEKDETYWVPDYSFLSLLRDASRAETLSFAWLVSGDSRYAEAARMWINFASAFRMDRHLDDRQRAEHDTVVYAYENGLKALALAYDWTYDQLTPDERAHVLAHVDYHTEAAGRWIRDRSLIHLEYQKSHVQQCMHILLTTVLATAKDSAVSDRWVEYLVPQYVNRIAWTSEDGGYFEGQTYGHKFGWILEGLASIRSACGIDLFQKPSIHNAGRYWLYAMNLNYWFNHWGDNYSLIWPWANPRDAYISGFLAAMTNDPYVKWYAETVLTDPEDIPFRYLSAKPLKSRPPVDIAQARVFPETGTVVAYDRFYDHKGARLFFRSSPWGSHSHSHADQNAFVIHDGGEILAPDTGYYTYSGDTYHYQWSKSTAAHNSMLVNGKGQPLGIGSKGRISSFFHGGKLTFLVGDASQAYEKPLETFRRAMLFIRPGMWVVYDELKAGEPARFNWLLNTFDKPKITSGERQIVVSQQQMRLQVDHLLPKEVQYSASNQRPYPILSPGRAWSRYTEAFPQPWHIEATNKIASKDEAFLALMHTWRASEEKAHTRTVEGGVFNTATTVGLEFESAMKEADKAGNTVWERGVVLFHRQQDASGEIGGGAISAHAQATAVLGQYDKSSVPHDWMLVAGRRLSIGNQVLWESEKPANVSAAFTTPGAAAVIRIDGDAGTLRLALPSRPKRIFAAPPDAPEKGHEVPFIWDEHGIAVLSLSSAESVVLWIDPVADLAAPLEGGILAVHDSKGDYEIPLRTGRNEEGGIVWFAETAPREPGEYLFSENEPTSDQTEFLIQDRWEPRKSSSGRAALHGVLREGSWVFINGRPGSPGKWTASLVTPQPRGEIDNLLYNGDMEEGTPGYPPRGWTLPQTKKSTLGWAEWSQKGPSGGRSCLRFYRDTDERSLVSRPMRLLSGGVYHLSFRSRGEINNASLRVRGPHECGISVAIQAGPEWSESQTEVKLPPGYCTIELIVPKGASGQNVWIDEIRFGKIESP